MYGAQMCKYSRPLVTWMAIVPSVATLCSVIFLAFVLEKDPHLHQDGGVYEQVATSIQ